MARESKEKLLEHLDALKNFPNSKLVKQLRQQIQRQIEKVDQTEIISSPKEIAKQANLSRSKKLERYHRYIRLIRDNFPDLSHAEIRKQFTKRRRGESVSINDAVWQNLPTNETAPSSHKPMTGNWNDSCVRSHSMHPIPFH